MIEKGNSSSKENDKKRKREGEYDFVSYQPSKVLKQNSQSTPGRNGAVNRFGIEDIQQIKKLYFFPKQLACVFSVDANSSVSHILRKNYPAFGFVRGAKLVLDKTATDCFIFTLIKLNPLHEVIDHYREFFKQLKKLTDTIYRAEYFIVMNRMVAKAKMARVKFEIPDFNDEWTDEIKELVEKEFGKISGKVEIDSSVAISEKDNDVITGKMETDSVSTTVTEDQNSNSNDASDDMNVEETKAVEILGALKSYDYAWKTFKSRSVENVPSSNIVVVPNNNAAKDGDCFLPSTLRK